MLPVGRDRELGEIAAWKRGPEPEDVAEPTNGPG
jgi:hypothetical protein